MTGSPESGPNGRRPWLEQALEAVLFVADEPVPAGDLAVLTEVPTSEVLQTLQGMAATMEERSAGLVLREVAGGWRLATHPSVAGYLERFVQEQRNPRLTRAALETLAIIAYRQPVSRAQIAEIRGVSSETVIRTLVSRGFIQEVGRDPGPGLAILYGTTQEFLERLGINELSDLPELPGFMPDTEAVERMESGLGPGV